MSGNKKLSLTYHWQHQVQAVSVKPQALQELITFEKRLHYCHLLLLFFPKGNLNSQQTSASNDLKQNENCKMSHLAACVTLISWRDIKVGETRTHSQLWN